MLSGEDQARKRFCGLFFYRARAILLSKAHAKKGCPGRLAAGGIRRIDYANCFLEVVVCCEVVGVPDAVILIAGSGGIDIVVRLGRIICEDEPDGRVDIIYNVGSIVVNVFHIAGQTGYATGKVWDARAAQVLCFRYE